MENSRRSIATNEDSMSMYLSFDADDTLASKWQSVMTSQTSHYLEVQQSMDMNETLEDNAHKDMKSVLKSLIHNESIKDQVSPLRPFDQSLLNKHNALCSTPTKNKTLVGGRHDLTATDANNKENTQPDGENTLSSTIDGTASTVKINTLLTETIATMDEISVQESNNKTNVYPLNADVILENITEVSNEEASMMVPSPEVVQHKVQELQQEIQKEEIQNEELKEEQQDHEKRGDALVIDVVNEVSQLITKALKLTDANLKPKEQQKQLPKLPTVALPRPRRSYLPTASGQTFKQRMSIVVKTTLNSPARKLIATNSSARRSCLPTAKPGFIAGYSNRKSMMIRSTETKSAMTRSTETKSAMKRSTETKSAMIRSTESSCSSSSVKTAQTIPAAARASLAMKPRPKPVAEDIKFNCHKCSASFRAKNQLDLHMRKHLDNDPLPFKNVQKPGSCKFCDKKFALERALHIHLLQNCEKIPPAAKRKLQYTELNHVKKALLPKLTVTSPAVGSASFKSRESTMPAVGSETSLATTEEAVATPMKPPPVSKVPKKMAHAGVFRTPTKSVPCHSCKLSFKSIIDYTNHCLTVHSKSRNKDAAED